jgi:hypothetical protein
VHRVTFDAGQNVVSFASARLFVADTNVRWLGRVVGSNGMSLGTVTLNGMTMLEVAHPVAVHRSLLRDTVLVRGVEYILDLTTAYRANQTYSWSVIPLLAGLPVQTIRSPGELTVVSPAGGSVIPRDRDLLLRWNGTSGRLSVVISMYEPLAKRSRPILELRPRTNEGSVRVPAKLLQALPRSQRLYIFSFILVNRRETDVTQPYAGRVLTQAGEVYNSFVELR